jgi:MoaA/NifB/PqqE/SkfB family radical SAM enzyme
VVGTILRIKGNYFPEKVTEFPFHGNCKDSDFMYYLIPLRGLRPLACWGCFFESPWGHGCLFWILLVVRWKSLRLADPSSRGILPSVCVWSRNLKNEDDLDLIMDFTPQKIALTVKMNVYFFIIVWLILGGGGRYHEYCQLRLNKMTEFSFTEDKDYLDTCCIWTVARRV